MRALFVMLVAVASATDCRALNAPPRPEATCTRACLARLKQCAEPQCLRGCNFVLDKLLEQEGDRVIACMEAARPACDDRAWASCAVRTGPHVDGGPPAPPPPAEE